MLLAPSLVTRSTEGSLYISYRSMALSACRSLHYRSVSNVLAHTAAVACIHIFVVPHRAHVLAHANMAYLHMGSWVIIYQLLSVVTSIVTVQIVRVMQIEQGGKQGSSSTTIERVRRTAGSTSHAAICWLGAEGIL